MLYYWEPLDKEEQYQQLGSHNFVYSFVIGRTSIDFTYGEGHKFASLDERYQKEVFNEDWDRINSRIKVINK